MTLRNIFRGILYFAEKAETNIFYYRMNVHIVQVLSSCEKINKVVKKSFGKKTFSTPTHGFLIFFDAYSLDLKNIFDACVGDPHLCINFNFCFQIYVSLSLVRCGLSHCTAFKC